MRDYVNAIVQKFMSVGKSTLLWFQSQGNVHTVRLPNKIWEVMNTAAKNLDINEFAVQSNFGIPVLMNQ